jgi:hypothetical protein
MALRVTALCAAKAEAAGVQMALERAALAALEGFPEAEAAGAVAAQLAALAALVAMAK